MGPAAREFNFTTRDFERVRRLIHALAGISLSDCKQDLVYGRLARRLRSSGSHSFDAYLNEIEAGNQTEIEFFVNALTTNLTSFFREAHHFPVLAEHAGRHKGAEPYRVWCSACSTGEEAYSIAITLSEVFARQPAKAQIIASDLDTQVLEAARSGVYPLDRVQGIDPARLRRFFQRGSGSTEGLARVRRELAALVRFEQVNLLDSRWPIEPGLDVIFCRNVMIYFDKPTQRKLLQQFLPLLKPDGLLICGHSESLMHCADLFRNLGRTVYAPLGGNPLPAR
ncbi:MAG: CheR family methyltransferase [Azoarcus sp.]|nr:CheR family methyltransferase [Azoarcus sp.]